MSMGFHETILVVVVTVGLSGCDLGATSQQATSTQKSPSGKYFLSVPIEEQTTDPNYEGTKVWKVTISDSEGKVVYKDEDSTMVGNLKIYWGWDQSDRVWVYNSDDGAIWRFEREPNGWKKVRSKKNDGIPEGILPDYAR